MEGTQPIAAALTDRSMEGTQPIAIRELALTDQPMGGTQGDATTTGASTLAVVEIHPRT